MKKSECLGLTLKLKQITVCLPVAIVFEKKKKEKSSDYLDNLDGSRLDELLHLYIH